MLVAISPSVVFGEPSTGVVVVGEDDLAEEDILEAASSNNEVEWRVERILPTSAPSRPTPSAELEAARGAYLEADFPTCLEGLENPLLAHEDTLAHGQIEVAIEVGVLRAACHLGIGNGDQARGALRDLYTRELDPATALEGTTIDVRSLAAQVRVEVTSGTRHAVTFRSTPPGAQVTIDGGSNQCARTPCRVTLIAGEHQITADLLGHEMISRSLAVEEDRELNLALAPATSEDARSQLANTLATDASPGRVDVARTALIAFPSDLLVLTWENESESHAMMYDELRQQMLSAVVPSGVGSLARVVGEVVTEWEQDAGIRRPLPRWAWPVTGVGLGVMAVGVALMVWMLVSPPEPNVQYDLVL